MTCNKKDLAKLMLKVNSIICLVGALLDLKLHFSYLLPLRTKIIDLLELLSLVSDFPTRLLGKVFRELLNEVGYEVLRLLLDIENQVYDCLASAEVLAIVCPKIFYYDIDKNLEEDIDIVGSWHILDL